MSCEEPSSTVGPSSASRPITTGVAERAVKLCFNGKYAEAEALLAPHRTSNARFALEYAISVMIRGLVSSTSESRETIMELFQVADGLAQKQKKSRPPVAEDPSSSQSSSGGQDGSNARAWKCECEVIYADALLVRAMTQLQMEQYLRGGLNLRKAWGCYSALSKEVELDDAAGKTIPDDVRLSVKLGCGLFYAALSTVPTGLMWILSLIGFVSDQALGEQLLTEVIESGSIRSPHAAMALLTFYLFIPTCFGDERAMLLKAKRVLDLVLAEFPSNTYFQGHANFYYRKVGDTAAAVAAIRKSIDSAEQSGSVPLLMKYLYADTLLAALQFEEAQNVYSQVTTILETSGEAFAYTGQVMLSIAACDAWKGDFDGALIAVQRAKKMYNPKSKQDVSSPVVAAHMIKDPQLLPLLTLYVLYINRDLHVMQPAHAETLISRYDCRGTDEEKVEASSSTEAQAMRNLFLGVLHRACGQKAEAAKCISDVLAAEKSLAKDSIALPYALYEMADMEFRSGNYPAAKTLLEKGSGMKGDGHDMLRTRYNISIRQLSRMA